MGEGDDFVHLVTTHPKPKVQSARSIQLFSVIHGGSALILLIYCYCSYDDPICTETDTDTDIHIPIQSALSISVLYSVFSIRYSVARYT